MSEFRSTEGVRNHSSPFEAFLIFVIGAAGVAGLIYATDTDPGLTPEAVIQDHIASLNKTDDSSELRYTPPADALSKGYLTLDSPSCKISDPLSIDDNGNLVYMVEAVPIIIAHRFNAGLTSTPGLETKQQLKERVC